MPKLTRTNFSVAELTTMYANGEIAIPEIQRDFIWDAKRIATLIDSLNRDYPSGAIILWRPEFQTRSEFEMLIRPERVHLYKDRLPTHLLLDGQQRLTALCSVTLPASEVMTSLGEEISLPNLFLNIKTLRIEARKDTISSSNNEILLNRLLSEETDESGLGCVLSELSARKDITSKHRNGLKDFRQRILQYSYPVQVLEGHSYETVADIFKRVNSQGRILVSAELELATIIPHWKGFSRYLRTFIKEMRGQGFNADLPFYMKCLAFIASDWPIIKDFSKGIVNGDYSKRELESSWRETKKSVRRLNRILERNNIDRSELITTRNALVPMVYAIAKDKKKKISDELLIKWLIYAMDGGHYTQQTEGVLKRDSYPLTQYLPDIEKGFRKMYRQMTKDDLWYTAFDESDFEGLAAKNPAMLFIYLALRHQAAKDFGGANATPIREIGKYQWHHIFPFDFMQGDEEAQKFRKDNDLNRSEFKERINDVANLTFLSLEANQNIKTRAPSDYLPKLTTHENLKAHCIPTEPELWRPRNYDKFCAERRRLLAKAMNSYVKNLK